MRERQTDRQTERDRQTDRQTDRDCYGAVIVSRYHCYIVSLLTDVSDLKLSKIGLLQPTG